MFRAIVFAVTDCGYVARSADEVDNGTTVRIQKICEIIEDCSFGIHDISRNKIDINSGYARFNMPLELGLFLGAAWLGDGHRQREKNALIFETTDNEYQKYCSDIGGQDIKAHSDAPKEAIGKVRDWLSKATQTGIVLPGKKTIWSRYLKFKVDSPFLLSALQLDEDDLTFNDYTTVVSQWLQGS